MGWNFVLDWRDYDPGLPPTTRRAARAVLWRGERLQMVYSARDRYFKFPGGGVEPGESWEEALAREVREETGLLLAPEKKFWGQTLERHRDWERKNLFEQVSHYYLCRAEASGARQSLDAYERAAEFELKLVSPWEALCRNEQGGPIYLEREILILRQLLWSGTSEGEDH